MARKRCCCSCPKIICGYGIELDAKKVTLAITFPDPFAFWVRGPSGGGAGSGDAWWRIEFTGTSVMDGDYVFTKDAHCVWGTVIESAIVSLTRADVAVVADGTDTCPVNTSPGWVTYTESDDVRMQWRLNVYEDEVDGERVLIVDMWVQLRTTIVLGGVFPTFVTRAMDFENLNVLRCVTADMPLAAQYGSSADEAWAEGCGLNPDVVVGEATPSDVL